MLFNSLSFLIFFPIVTVAYYLSPKSWRWLVLLIASCYFYITFIPSYILILGFLITVDYCMGILIENAQNNMRKYFLIISIISNIGILFTFKYFNFFNTNINSLAHLLHWNYSITLLELVLPIGLSFHTFQSLSYIIEVYNRRQKAERHFGIYALYVMFYPQLVAGPIERPQHMLHQFHQEHSFDEKNISEGLTRIVFGLFKKVVIADRLDLIVNTVYGIPTEYVGIPLVLATIAFSLQVYCDFSGYSDIAIGAAKVMGFQLVENFNYPYLSKNIQDFWRRWHMSLYAWFRDYVYIPLGGNRVNTKRHYVNILVVFALTGLWHGAKWTYVLWGIIHAIYIIVTIVLGKYFSKLNKSNIPSFINAIFTWLEIILTFALVSLAWIFFRASTIQDAWYIVSHLTRGIGSFVHSLLTQDLRSANAYFFNQGRGIGLNTFQLTITLIALVVMMYVEYLQRHMALNKIPVWWRWFVLLGVAFMICNATANNLIPFIYFQF